MMNMIQEKLQIDTKDAGWKSRIRTLEINIIKRREPESLNLLRWLTSMILELSNRNFSKSRRSKGRNKKLERSRRSRDLKLKKR